MKIEFIPSTLDVELFLESPKPSKHYIPKWYKNIKANNDLTFDENKNLINLNVKNCMPFFDGLSHGYMQSTWHDIYISKNENGDIEYTGSNTHLYPPLMSHRENGTNIESDSFYEKTEFVWFVQWIPKMPKGWSVLIVPPLNHFNLPFTPASGIIDADKFYNAPSGMLPFYLKKGFEGLIPVGTPMYQIIPIKRKFWSSKIIKFNQLFWMKKERQYLNIFAKAYKNNFWQKKSFS